MSEDSEKLQILVKSILDIPAESIYIEFKRLSGDGIVKKVCETVVAFANTEGGTIILGVEGPLEGRNRGVDRIFGIEENLERYDEIIRELGRIIPPCIWEATKVDTKSGKTIGLINVPKALDDFHSLNNHVFVRQERGNRLLTAHEIQQFAYVKGFHHADEELVKVDVHLLETQEYQVWCKARKISSESISEVLEKTGLARKNEQGELLPTRAAVMLFADFPTYHMDTKCAIRIFQYAGKEITYGEVPNLIGVPITLNGPLVRMLADAHSQVLNMLKTGIRVPSGFTNRYNIPERAIKEAITNAVIHRDYFTKRDIEIHVFEDRVEVHSPGLFPSNITRANIGLTRALSYRNGLLVKHLREFPEPPNLDQSEGVKAMRSQMAEQMLYPPIFISYPIIKDGVCVVLYNERIATEWEKVKEFLDLYKYITNEQARSIIYQTDRAKVSRLLGRWVQQGLLVKNGEFKYSRYRLPEAREL